MSLVSYAGICLSSKVDLSAEERLNTAVPAPPAAKALLRRPLCGFALCHSGSDHLQQGSGALSDAATTSTCVKDGAVDCWHRYLALVLSRCYLEERRQKYFAARFVADRKAAVGTAAVAATGHCH